MGLGCSSVGEHLPSLGKAMGVGGEKEHQECLNILFKQSKHGILFSNQKELWIRAPAWVDPEDIIMLDRRNQS